MTAGRRDESGSVVPLLVGFAVIVALLVGVVVDASAAYLRRQGLNSLADAAALAATEGLQGQQVYTHGLPQAGIDPVAAEAYVADHLRETGAQQRFPGLRLEVETRDRTVIVRLSAPLELPFAVPGVVESPVVTGSAAAQVIVTD